ncbi:kinase-like domain-containing protein [Rhizophagus irregularis DAOM 181602=DAOM 197198]|nr:kinase-like domain-containing protein [Rhizophagus irregularis DAOM 181602=DAOM 197198]
MYMYAFKLQYHVRADQDVLHKHTYSHNWFAYIKHDFNCKKVIHHHRGNHSLVFEHVNVINPNDILIYQRTIKLVDFGSSRKLFTSFDYEMRKNDLEFMLEILNGERENPIPNTNSKFVVLYKR